MEQSKLVKKNPIILLVIGFYCFSAMVVGNGSYITVFSKILLTLTAAYYSIIAKHPVIGKTFYYWNIAIFLFCAASLRWSVDISTSKSVLLTFLFVVICNISLFYLLSCNTQYFIKLLKYFIIFGLLMAVRGFLTFGSIEASERAEMAADGFNVNILGINCAIGLLCAFYFYKISDKNKIIYLLLTLLCGIVIILTGSKKALLIPLIALAIYRICHSTKRFIIISILGVVLGGLLLWYLLMNVSFLYDNIGFRFEGLINGITGDGDVDASSKARLRFIEMGYEMIKENLSLGYGLGTFRYLNFIMMGDDHYSHNNFIELSVGVGIVGLIIYYWIYIYCICNLIKIIRHTGKELPILLLSIMIGFMVGHYGFVAYYDLTSNIILSLIVYKTMEWKKALGI